MSSLPLVNVTGSVSMEITNVSANLQSVASRSFMSNSGCFHLLVCGMGDHS